MPNKNCLPSFLLYTHTQVHRRHLSNDWNPARIVLATHLALYRSDNNGFDSGFLSCLDDYEKPDVWSMECRTCTCDTCLSFDSNKFYFWLFFRVLSSIHHIRIGLCTLLIRWFWREFCRCHWFICYEDSKFWRSTWIYTKDRYVEMKQRLLPKKWLMKMM